MQPDFSQIGPFLVAALVVFAIYRRFRRSFGRQVLRPTRMTIRIVLFVLIGCSLMPVAVRSGAFLSAVAAGLAVGVALGVWGAERTRFVTYDSRLHYIPHTYTGIAVSLLFLGRLVYRVVQMYTASHAGRAANVYAADPTQGFAPASMVRSPLTVGLLFVLIGYYVYYYSAVLWKSKHLKAEDIEIVPAAASR